MITVAIDVMGGDHGPRVTIPATLALLKEDSNIKVILVGLSEAIDAQLRLHKASNHPRIRIQHASEVVLMDESPQSAMKNKKRFFYACGD
jgi:glycerol-3-phosphate acyltransferase PlsX